MEKIIIAPTSKISQQSTMSNNDDNNNQLQEQESQEPMFRLDLDCRHSQVVPASKLAKPARREPVTRAAMFLCPSCYRREKGACSIDPVHRVVAITALPPPTTRPTTASITTTTTQQD
jgi:hypothetical protein